MLDNDVSVPKISELNANAVLVKRLSVIIE
jgi:hypothetical protein